MKKLFNMLPLLLGLSVSLSAISFSAYAFLNPFYETGEKPAVKTGAEPLKEFSLSKVFSGFELIETETEDKKESSVTVSASPSEAQGKIYEQFISPYSAKLNYNGIYIKNSTGLSVDIKKELSSEFNLKLENTSKPQVLIVHTHATESYMSEERGFYTAKDKPRNTDNSKNVTKVGEIIANRLKEGGIGVIHDRTQHDHPAYNGSYGRAAKTINEYLKKYPSIKIVVDVHRDSIAMTGSDKCKPTVTVDGKKAAQVMLVMGSQTGTVTNFPNWRQNFRLALRYQQTMEEMYPGLARAMLFCSRCYNENLTTGSMILEVGTDSNSFEEACYSAELTGNALVRLLKTLK